VSAILARAQAFCSRFGLRVPILLAPMAGASAPSLSAAVANAGGLGACGVLVMRPEEIVAKGFERDVVMRIWSMLDKAEYKRRQAAPGVKITRRAFGRDRRYPITNRFKG